MRSEEEIRAALNATSEVGGPAGSHARSYYHGARLALKWVLDKRLEAPPWTNDMLDTVPNPGGIAGGVMDGTYDPGGPPSPGIEHKIEIASKFLEPGWWAECSCGWASEHGLSSEEAQNRGNLHRETS